MCFVALVGARPKTKGGVECFDLMTPAGATSPGVSRTTGQGAYLPLLLVVDFLAVDFLAVEPELFFAVLAFFVAMALVPPFYAAQSKER